MTDLSTQERAFLDAARSGDDPTPEARDRMRAKLFAQVGIGAAAAGATVTAAGVAGAATSGASGTAASGMGAKAATAAAATGAVAVGKTSLIAKLATGLAVVTLAGGGGYVVTQPGEVAETAEASVAVPVARAAEQAQSQAEAAATPAPVEEEAAEGDAIEAPSPTPPARVARRAAPKSPAASGTTASSIDDELGLLRSAQEKLQAGDADEALAMLDDHEREHHGGNLGEERLAVRVFALCQKGRKAEARAAAARFLARFPKSPLASRVANACTADP